MNSITILSWIFGVWTTNLEAIVDAFSCELQDPRRQAGKTISIAVTFLYCLLLHYPLGYLLFLQISVGFSSSRISAKLNDHRLAFEHIPINQILQWIVFNLAFSVCTKMKLIYASNQEGKKKPNYILLPQVDWTKLLMLPYQSPEVGENPPPKAIYFFLYCSGDWRRYTSISGS